ncbi:unnamed protein product [Ilex paraguariensis]|uniref:DUF641 domain-containing protein n=1 Tax=Ilex paraguariensis TaxID=185542 RepID=A0ABC8RI49_9AQUA
MRGRTIHWWWHNGFGGGVVALGASMGLGKKEGGSEGQYFGGGGVIFAGFELASNCNVVVALLSGVGELESYSRRMECAAKPFKPPSNISEIGSTFAKVCRFRSIGVLRSENPHHHQLCPSNGTNVLPLADDSSYDTEEGECDGEKVHPSVKVQIKSMECDHVILKLFEAISALKLAYVYLQGAHISFDPDKIRASNEVIVSQLEALSKIKRAYKEKQFGKFNSILACLAFLLAKIQVQERQLKKLKTQNQVKEAEIASLRHDFHDLDLNNRKLVEELRQREKEDAGLLNVSSFQDIAKAASKAIHDFTKPLIALMKSSGWDLDKAANAIENSVVYSKRSHKKYAFEAYIVRRMFYEISFQSYYVGNIVKFDDPIDALIEEPDSSFSNFCRTKYLLVVHPKMEASFFGNLDHRSFVSSGRHPRTPFYQAFLKMARWVFILRGLAASTEPKVKMFGVRRGSEFSDAYMERAPEYEGDMVVYDEERSRFKVEFMVAPGFKFGETVVRSRVYTSKM